MLTYGQEAVIDEVFMIAYLFILFNLVLNMLLNKVITTFYGS